MSWTLLMMALGAICLVVAAAAIQIRRGNSTDRAGYLSPFKPGQPAGGSVTYFGLAPQDAVQFERAAQADMRREQGLWDRDYLPDTTVGTLPGRVTGIPRSLRVRGQAE